MPIANVDLQDHVHGDTWPGISSIVITVNGVTPATACSRVTMGFGKAETWPAYAYALSSDPDDDEGAITIVSGAGWSFAVPAQLLPLEPGEWKWDMRFTDAGGVVSTYLGGVLTVSQNVAPV